MLNRWLILLRIGIAHSQKVFAENKFNYHLHPYKENQWNHFTSQFNKLSLA